MTDPYFDISACFGENKTHMSNVKGQSLSLL